MQRSNFGDKIGEMTVVESVKREVLSSPCLLFRVLSVQRPWNGGFSGVDIQYCLYQPADPWPVSCAGYKLTCCIHRSVHGLPPLESESEDGC